MPKILSGQKTIESRWYLRKCAPLDKIKSGDIVYFKNSGQPIKIKTRVRKVLQFENLTPNKIKSILKKYGSDDGIEKEKTDKFFKMFKNKKYCILIFLKRPVQTKPFDINKTGFGSMSAWLSVSDISKIKKSKI